MPEPSVEAPAPSSSRARVKESTSPAVVASTTIQKNVLVRLKRSSEGAVRPIHAASGSAITCDSPITPKPIAMSSMRSVSVGMRAWRSRNSVTRRRSASMADVSAPMYASMAVERLARKSSTASQTFATRMSTAIIAEKSGSLTSNTSFMAA